VTAVLRISFPPLPTRPRSLDKAELSAVFGGCLDYEEECQKDSDCCDNGPFACKDYISNSGKEGRMCLRPW
jgi:hypothetical protein